MRTLLAALVGALLAALLVALLTGCTAAGPGPGRATTSSQPPAPDVAARAAAFGRVVLPPGVEVRFADQQGFQDTLVRLTLRTDPAGVTALLAASGFTAPLRATTSAGPVPAGPDLATSPSVLTAQDAVDPPGAARVFRTVVVDERDATTRWVHLSLFTT